MKIKDILVEDKYDPKDLVGDNDKDLWDLYVKQGMKVAAFIKKNCGPWMKAVGTKDTIFRGFQRISKDKLAFTKAVRLDRKPMDSSRKEHNTFDRVIKDCGKVANRSNSLFVTGDDDLAESYGAPFVVFPIGQFNYTWHTQVEDWSGTYELENAYEADPDDVKIPPEMRKEAVRKAKAAWEVALKKNKFYQPLPKKPKDLEAFKKVWIENHAYDEIMDYVDKQVNTPEVIMLSLKKHVCPKIKGDDGTLLKAIRSRHEIMISSKAAVAVNPKFYQYIVSHLLDGKIPKYDRHAGPVADLFRGGDEDDSW